MLFRNYKSLVNLFKCTEIYFTNLYIELSNQIMFKLNTSRLPAIIRYQNHLVRPCTTTTTTPMSEEKEKELERIAKDATIDEPPTACCQSGCSNCVFIVWAEALSAKMKDAGPELGEKILQNVEDPNMKAYLGMELRMRGIKK